MKGNLQQFEAEMKVWRKLGRLRYPTQAHCNVYKRLLAEHKKERVIEHIDWINEVLDKAEERSQRKN